MKIYPKYLVQNFIIVILSMFFALPTGVYGAGGPRGYDPELSRPELGVPFTGYSVLCEILDPGTYVEDRNRGSLRDAVLRYRALTDQPETTGWVTLTMNYDLHLKSGKGTSWGESELVPDMGMGTFVEEEYTIKAKKFVWDVTGTMIGTGGFVGYTVDFFETPADINDVPADTCGINPVMGVSNFSCYIYAPQF